MRLQCFTAIVSEPQFSANPCLNTAVVVAIIAVALVVVVLLLILFRLILVLFPVKLECCYIQTQR